MKVSILRKEHFNAAHRLFNPNWDNAKNFEVFGKCSNPNYHGHNYDLEVKVTGEINSDTGFVMDVKKLGDIINTHVYDRFDHKNLNLDTVEFANLNPTAENIVIVIWEILRPLLPNTLDLSVKLWETENNCAEYFG